MLDGEGLPYRYRDYRREPLDAAEIRAVLDALGVAPRAVVRTKERAYGEEGLAEADDDTLIAAMARHPTLLQRPIGVRGARAVLGRPPERLLELYDEG